jgi:TonB-linked SusC/RagA family outer membrane protein
LVEDRGDLSTIASYFTRVNYSFKNRYLLNASLRADGSSKFFGDQRWGYFPSVGVGWVISDEPFMQNQQIFNNLKVRGSWGKIGNASVPSNLSVLRVAQGNNLIAVYGPPGSPVYSTGASINSIVPPTTYWERGIGTDIGLEASLLNNKLFLEAAYYNKKTEQAIFDLPILGSIGTESSKIVGNQATFQNQGYELTATWRNTISKALSFTVSGNATYNKNKVLNVITGNNPIYAGGTGATGGALITRTVSGQPIGQFFGYQVAGIFQNAAEVASSPQTDAKPGDFRYVDQNKDGRIDGNDRIPLGNPNPKYTYGINTTWNYAQFDLTLDFQGVAGVDIYNANLGLRYGNENFTKDFFEHRWHGEGTSNTYPSANIGGGQNYLPNSFFVESGSYFRIRNMQLGYTLPRGTLDRWKIKSLRVYIGAQNAFNFFKYRGFSPEVGGTPTNAGIDVDVYPLFATYNFGVNANF